MKLEHNVCFNMLLNVSYSNNKKAVYHFLAFILFKVALFESSDDKENIFITIFS